VSILDPIEAQLQSGLAAVEQRVRVIVETAILRSIVKLFLTRLKVLDTSRQADYSTALQALGDGE
jgi:hypothetical protein